MLKKKITSIILIIGMLTSSLLTSGVMAYTQEEKTKRQVYLHAQGDTPSSTSSSSTVYLGDTADIYFAVDDPNKGDYLDENDDVVIAAAQNAHVTATEKANFEAGWSQDRKENYINTEVAKAIQRARHSESKYDMNGYRLCICYDPKYLELPEDTVVSCPIDYKVPESKFNDADTEQGTVGGKPVGTVPTSIGYFLYDNGQGTYTYAGKEYNTAYITVFYGGDFVPQKNDDELWYNLAKLSLKAIKEGSTDVFIATNSGEERFDLELFAKNDDSDELPDQSFDYSAMHGGFHTLVIKDKARPTPPVAEPTTGSYPERVDVTLRQNENLTIYYTTDGSDPSKPESTRQIYKEPIPVTMDTIIRTCAYRDGKYSDVVEYEYNIIPERPYLFFTDKTTLVPDIYPASNKFTVLLCDDEKFGQIADENEIYYTFSNAEIPDDLSKVTSDPDKAETEWVKADKLTQSVVIDRKTEMRLFTAKYSTIGEEKSVNLSEVVWYYFSIKPAPAVASYESRTYSNKIDVTLETKTEGAEIFYTIDGSDPKTSITARPYDGIPITIYKDTTLRTVAQYDGEWSDKKTYNYLFNYYDDYGVNAFYPSGVYEGNVNVTLTPNNPEYEVWYCDGDGEWQKYEKIISVGKDTIITAKAVELNPDGTVKSQGEEYYFTYKIKPLPPEFAPESTQFTNADNVSIYTPDSDANTTGRYTLFYTLDGSDPTTSDTRIKADDVSDSVTIKITDYTEISAVVFKDNTTYSTVVTHSYDIVTVKPVKPLTTLLPGYYTHEVGGEVYTTQFMPVPNNTRIYYTISYDGGFCPDPIPDTAGTYLYDGTYEIPLKGNTIIKAVAVNSFGIKSDIGIFSYTITPEAPIAAPSASLSEFPLVPVDAVKGSRVEYTIGDETNSFDNLSGERFYIDTKTGNAYRNEDGTEPLGKEINAQITSTVILEITSTLDGVTSDSTQRVYTVNPQNKVPAPPYADKDTGMYEEKRIDDSNNFLSVSLCSLNSGAIIEYRINDGEWEEYAKGDKLLFGGDATLQVRCAEDGNFSTVVSYVYNFEPMAPIIELASGTYLKSDKKTTTIYLRDDAPKNADYTVWYRENGDPNDYEYKAGRVRSIDHTMSFKAYVVNNTTGRKSKNTIHYYIIESGDGINGTVDIAYPYDTDRISAHLLGSGSYAEGIRLISDNKNADIYFKYIYTRKSDGKKISVGSSKYDVSRPIIPTELMDDISITAWLVDRSGSPIDGSERTFDIDFVHLGIPTTSLEESGKVEFDKGTKYTLKDDGTTGENPDTLLLYYTLDGSDPVDSTTRIIYKGEEITLNNAVTVRTVYFSACGKCKETDDISECTHGVYGKSGTYKYTVPTTITINTGGSGGGGGGGGTKVVDKTRKYTKDIFGNEHPTHIGYINGYPDGSVRPEGDITREEITAILYRITNHDYEKPIVVTGKVFPDVGTDRWSHYEIEYMADKGVVTGYPDGSFKPLQSLTRSEFAALIYRFTGIKEPTTDNPFPDVSKDHWAYKEILALKEAELVLGDGDGNFRPEDNITRAEAMTVINKLLGRKPLDSNVKSLDFKPFNDLRENEWYYVAVIEATITHNYYLNDTGYEYKWEDWK